MEFSFDRKRDYCDLMLVAIERMIDYTGAFITEEQKSKYNVLCSDVTDFEFEICDDGVIPDMAEKILDELLFRTERLRNEIRNTLRKRIGL